MDADNNVNSQKIMYGFLKFHIITGMVSIPVYMVAFGLFIKFWLYEIDNGYSVYDILISIPFVLVTVYWILYISAWLSAIDCNYKIIIPIAFTPLNLTLLINYRNRDFLTTAIKDGIINKKFQYVVTMDLYDFMTRMALFQQRFYDLVYVICPKLLLPYVSKILIDRADTINSRTIWVYCSGNLFVMYFKTKEDAIVAKLVM